MRVAAKALGHDGVGAARAGEPAVFREAAELDGALARAGDFVNGMGNGRVRDVGLVGGIEEDDGLVREGVGHPRLELRARGDGTRGVVRRAKINDVRVLFRRLGDEAVGRRAGQIDQAGVGAVRVGVAGVAGHDVGIDIDRIDGVADGDFVLVPENVEDVAAIAFGAVADEDFVVGDFEAVVAEIVFGNGAAQEVVALLGAVAAEGGAARHFIDGAVQRRDDGGRERLGDIADAAADEAFGGVGVGVAEGFHAPADFGKEVAGFEFEVVVVEVGHGRRGLGSGV